MYRLSGCVVTFCLTRILLAVIEEAYSRALATFAPLDRSHGPLALYLWTDV